MRWYIMASRLITILIKKPTKKGKNYIFNIPIEYIRSGKISPNKKYKIPVLTIPDEHQE